MYSLIIEILRFLTLCQKSKKEAYPNLLYTTVSHNHHTNIQMKFPFPVGLTLYLSAQSWQLRLLDPVVVGSLRGF